MPSAWQRLRNEMISGARTEHSSRRLAELRQSWAHCVVSLGCGGLTNNSARGHAKTMMSNFLKVYCAATASGRTVRMSPRTSQRAQHAMPAGNPNGKRGSLAMLSPSICTKRCTNYPITSLILAEHFQQNPKTCTLHDA